MEQERLMSQKEKRKPGKGEKKWGLLGGGKDEIV